MKQLTFAIDIDSNDDYETAAAIAERTIAVTERFLRKRQRKLAQALRQHLPPELQHIAEPVIDQMIDNLLLVQSVERHLYETIYDPLIHEALRQLDKAQTLPELTDDDEIPF